MCHVEKLVHYFQCQGHSKDLHNQIWLFLLCILNCWSVCNQTWFDSTASQAEVSCGKIGLLCLRSRSQQRFKMSVCAIVSAQYLLKRSTIFNIFFTKLGMVVYCYEAMCHTGMLVHYHQCQGHSEGLNKQNMTISTISSKLLVCLRPNLFW